ncbi:MAG: DUF721 domain-containing protein [Proteobacteria bacterium]|nr:DUF721 domain-containing protein [Pseudomonadota bacterium]
MKRTSFGLQPLEQKLADLLKPMFVGSKKEFILINNLTKNWSEIIGKKYEKLCYPQSVKFAKIEKNATLTIGVYNPSVGFFLESNSESIVERIAVLYGFKSITKIIIKQDPKNIASDKATEIKLSQAQEKNLNEKTAKVADENLVEVLRKLGREILQK